MSFYKHWIIFVGMNLNVKNTKVCDIEVERKWPPFPKRYFHMQCLNENLIISINTSLKFVPDGHNNNTPALVQMMAWCQPGNKHWSEQWCFAYWRIYASLCHSELNITQRSDKRWNFAGIFMEMTTGYNKQPWKTVNSTVGFIIAVCMESQFRIFSINKVQ